MRSGAYYNEIDPYCVEWLRNLITAGLIPAGDVDSRSIEDVTPDDLAGYVQCHFFAGLGGWAYATRLAGWPDDRPIWTGSCPCQPFSKAGKRRGFSDPRHLWPKWFRLIRERKPPVVMGEQSDEAITSGWLDAAFDDMEAADYSCGAAILPAVGVGIPTLRYRAWFVAHANSGKRLGRDCPMQMGWIRSQEEAAPDSVGVRPKWSIEPRFPIVSPGVPFRMERCRAAGNAIAPELAAEVIRAYMEAVDAALSDPREPSPTA